MHYCQNLCNLPVITSFIQWLIAIKIVKHLKVIITAFNYQTIKIAFILINNNHLSCKCKYWLSVHFIK